eukprot:m.464833 g.464833  ORF g.464833 m.464833 type:complete len:221 (-) comp23792_c0_seq1:1251-1913(-)
MSFRAKVLEKKDRSPARLLIIDKSVDSEEALATAALDTVVVVKYDGTIHTFAELLGKIKRAHTDTGHPFASIAFANHGPENQSWTIASDLHVDLSEVGGATKALNPLIEVLIDALDRGKKGEAHIDFLACSLASVCPQLVPTLEKLHEIDFRASIDVTGNETAPAGGNWEMETDGYNVVDDYFDPEGIKAYTESMGKKGIFARVVFHVATGGMFLPFEMI